MVSNKFILFLTISIIVVVLNIENANAEILSEYRKDIYYRVMLCLNESTLLSPVHWCDANAISVNIAVLETNRISVCKDKTGVQTPSQFCSSERTPNPSGEKLARLSALGLSAPTSTEMDVNNTPEHLEMTSQTDLGASSTRDFDLNLTTEEYNEMVEKKNKIKNT